MRTPVLSSLLAVVLAAGCAATNRNAARVDDARLARLPPDTRAALIDKNHAIDVARSNVAAAKVALADANQFRSAVKSEHDAAKSRVDAAKKALDLANRNPSDSAAIDNAKQAEVAARERLDASDAKLRYADDLVALRQKQVDFKNAEADAAQADVELERYDQLEAANQASGLKRTDFVSARDRAHTHVSNLERDVAKARDAVQSGQQAWRQRHDRLQASAKGSGDVVEDAPPPPEPIQ